MFFLATELNLFPRPLVVLSFSSVTQVQDAYTINMAIVANSNIDIFNCISLIHHQNLTRSSYSQVLCVVTGLQLQLPREQDWPGSS